MNNETQQKETAPAALVTGASRGLGRRIALAFAGPGATVGIGYCEHAEAAEATAADVRNKGATAVLLPGDLTVPETAKQIVNAFLEATGKRLDVLVNNAGVCADRATARMSDAQWDDVLNLDLDAPARLIKAASRAMMRRRSGHVVNIGSHAGVLGRTGGANYAAAKAGLLALTRSAARELGAAGIAVNAVLPGVLGDTDMGAAAGDAWRDQQRRQAVLGRPGQADEVAAFVAHLTTMQCVSGQVFVLDSRILRWG